MRCWARPPRETPEPREARIGSLPMSRPGHPEPRAPRRSTRRLEQAAAGNRRLLVAAAVSVLLHLAFAALLLAGSGAPDSPQQMALETPPPPPEPPDTVTLGSERSEATSITWIGFDEYQEHVLQNKSQVDQPELSLDASSGAPAQPTVAQTPPTPPTPQSIEAPEIEAPPALADAAKPPTPDQPPEPQDPAPVLTQAPTEAPDPANEAPDVAPAEKEPTLTDRVGPLPKDPEPESTTPATEQSASEEPAGPPAPQDPSPKPQEPTPPSTQPPSPPGAAPGNDAPGEQSDKESDASATITATVSKLGRPLVAHGLEIQTIRPRFTYYTQVTASPRSPIVRVEFDRRGKVYRAQILRSSGSPDVDRPLLDAIYQWRATGKQLEGLSAGNPPQTVSIEFRILL